MSGSMTRRQFACRAAACGAAVGLLPAAGCGSPRQAGGRPWPMKLATSSVMFAELPIEQACERARRIGLDALDIWGPFKHYKTHCDHLKDVKQRLGGKGLRALMRKHRLEVAAFTLYQQCELADYVDLIRDYGGGIVVRSDRARPSAPEEISSNMRAFFETLKPEIERAEQANAVLAIENHAGGLLNPLDSFKAFVDLNPNPERVGIAFAPFHLQGYKKIPMEEFLRTAAPQMRFFYAWQRGTQKDAFGTGQLPGFGPVDFTSWLRTLAGADYAHYLSIFLHGHGAVDETEAQVATSRSYLMDCYKNI